MQQSESTEGSRRQLFAVARLPAGAAPVFPNLLFGVGMALGFGSAQSQDEPVAKQGTETTFTSPKRVEAGRLSIEYAEVGPADGPAVILVHGWPYGIHSYVDVAPLLASRGYRVIIPYLCGYSTACFPSSDTVPNGRHSFVAQEILQLMDALNIQKAIVAGLDWGARTVNIMAALWPERCKALVSVGGYLISSPEAKKKPLPRE